MLTTTSKLILDETHDLAFMSWVESANEQDSDFPIQNLPFGRFRRAGTSEPWRIGVAIGNSVLDLRAASYCTQWTASIRPLLQPLAEGDLKGFMSLEPDRHRLLRHALFNALLAGSAMRSELESCLVAQSAIDLTLPCDVGDYSDFLSGFHHAVAAGRQMRPERPQLPPNLPWIPLGYHGRASSIVPSGTLIQRPRGQCKAADMEHPVFAASRRLDFELEIGYLVGRGNPLGHPIPMAAADRHLFGMVLLNDWSARDIQAWEAQPLGPFLAKSFATTISCWVVTMDALAPFRVPLMRPETIPQPLPYLNDPSVWQRGGLNISLEARLQTKAMREAGTKAMLVARTNTARASFWSPEQLVAHQTSSGCNLRSGDLLGSGTMSGPVPEEAGSLLELTSSGSKPIVFPNGESRGFLRDGDTVILRACCVAPGFRRLGFGECRGTVIDAIDPSPNGVETGSVGATANQSEAGYPS